MQPVIKFRSWNGYKMDYDPWASEFSGEGSPINSPIKELQKNGSIIMQFTGAKDSNGKDIYFGDVIDAIAKDDFKESSGSKFVVWSNDLGVALADKIDHGFGLSPTWTGWANLRVRGNIYENPELLK